MTFDELVAQLQGEHQARLAEILARTNELAAALLERDSATNHVYALQLDLADANRAIVNLQAELDECRNPTPPPPPIVRMGMYSGTRPELEAREAQLGVHDLFTWIWFPIMGQTFGANKGGWDTPRAKLINLHMKSDANTHVAWSRVIAGEFDARLITSLKAIGELQQGEVFLSPQEEMDGQDGRLHGGPAEYRALALKILGMARQYAPRAKVGMALASSSNAALYLVPELDWFAVNPHFYTVNGSTGLYTAGTVLDLAQRCHDDLVAAGMGDKPWMLHTGISEPMTEAQAIAAGFANGNGLLPGNVISGNTLVSESIWKAAKAREWNDFLRNGPQLYPDLFEHLIRATYWDRKQPVNNRGADERIDSSPASLAAFKELFTP